MKKIVILIVFWVVWYPESMAIKPMVTKTISPHYSGLSGRRYAIPRTSMPEESVIVRATPPATYAEELANAQEKNRMMRLEQLQRSSKKPYGTYRYYSSSVAPIGGTTP